MVPSLACHDQPIDRVILQALLIVRDVASLGTGHFPVLVILVLLAFESHAQYSGTTAYLVYGFMCWLWLHSSAMIGNPIRNVRALIGEWKVKSDPLVWV